MYKGKIESNRFNNYHLILIAAQGAFKIEHGMGVSGVLEWVNFDAEDSYNEYGCADGYSIALVSKYNLTNLKTREWVRINLCSACLKGKTTQELVRGFSDDVWDKLARQLLPSYSSLPESEDSVVAESNSYQHWNDRDAYITNQAHSLSGE